MTNLGAHPAARVLEPGPFTTIQDSGRFGYRRFGVPVSGALDLDSLSFANSLLGNRPERPGLEIFNGPIVLSAMEDTEVGHSGNSAVALVDGRPSKENPLKVRAGSTVSIDPGENSTVVYLAFPGGLACDGVLGSASTYTRARLGGLGGRILQEGDFLYALGTGVGGPVPRREAVLERPEYHRVIRGPHADLLPAETLQNFFKTEYRISFDIDRMGYRLEGPVLQGFQQWGRVLTLPVFPGMVQVPPDGRPIVLMRDCQTTGGYPVIAVVLDPDLGALAQKPPGAPVSFKEVTDEESHRITESFSLATGLRPSSRL